MFLSMLIHCSKKLKFFLINSNNIPSLGDGSLEELFDDMMAMTATIVETIANIPTSINIFLILAVSLLG